MTAGDFRPEAESAFIYATGLEDRAGHVDAWPDHAAAALVEVVSQDRAAITLRIANDEVSAYLRSGAQLRSVLGKLPAVLYLDITGLAHHVWAPLLRGALDLGKRVWGVYVEPEEYTRTTTPTEGTIYDLSDRIEGIAPIPGFASLTEPEDEQFAFIPLLGFEGTRLIHMTEHVQPSAAATVPVVGVPGFRSEYPFVSLKGNRKPLVDGATWVNMRYSTANCPFDLFFTLQSIVEEFDYEYVRIAPIGTKPHGLGAVLFTLSVESRVELIYDHPIRKLGRTSGAARLCLYDISTFVDSDEFRWA
ncbi:MAG: hypothetical protein ACREX3_17345 [Gammaproteobacteria bacterium]